MKIEKQEIFTISVPEGKVRDYIDGVFRNDTPEEYVRQNIEKRLVNEHFYPKNLIKIEKQIKVGSARKRVDIAKRSIYRPRIYSINYRM